MDETMKKMIDYCNKEGIDYSKTKSGKPNMISKQNRELYNKMKEECIICSEKMKGTTVLDCGHKMCTICCIKHFRKNENCPFCRKLICEKVEDDYEDMIDTVLETRYTTRHNLSMFDFIIEKINGEEPIDCIAFDILNEIKLTCLDTIMLSHE